eukprot:TRINITY_DN523_c0_g1_i4.p1 TRINITY_DN523_c0_g1~~TRINITY_DN523_c0_g1_i4.p1  ORF type:complete len:347 (+),score=60.82 TRINITY_DN523_c0_g1_i4:30-1070(+)
MTSTYPPMTDPMDAKEIFLEELKSDDLPLKLNAMKRLVDVAKALGPIRTREELLPLLTELDESDDVLLAAAEELGNFVECVGGAEHVHSLLKPLEVLARVEEPVVREKAVESLTKLVPIFPDPDLEYFVSIIRNLSRHVSYDPRISSCGLFAIAYPRVNETTKRELICLFGNLCRDPTPMVRRAACTHLKNYVKTVDTETVKQDLLPMYSNLANDDQDSVRMLAVDACVAIVERLGNDDSNVQFILPTILKSISDKSWRVRFKVADNFKKICEAFGPELTKKELLAEFIKLLKDSEAEVRTAATSKVTGVSLLVGSDLTTQLILPCIQLLVQDASQSLLSLQMSWA